MERASGKSKARGREGGITRRFMALGTIATVGTIALKNADSIKGSLTPTAASPDEGFSSGSGEQHRTMTAEQEREEKLLAMLQEAKPEEMPTGLSENEQIVGLEHAYLGYPEVDSHKRLGEFVTVNGPRALNALWEKKRALMAGTRDEERVGRTATDRMLDYTDRWNHPEKYGASRAEAIGRGSIEDIRDGIEANIKPMREALQRTTQARGTLEALYGINIPAETTTLRDLIGKIDGNMLTSYTMTELLWGDNGEQDIHKYDLLLRTIGKQGLAVIPSLGDKVDSFGQYQMTDYGFMDTSPSLESMSVKPFVRVGAAKPNSILPDNLIVSIKDRAIVGGPPVPLKRLDDLYSYDEHVKITFLYAVNILGSVLGSNAIAAPLLQTFKDMPKDELLSFIAVSHNNPALGKRALLSWLEETARGREVSFREICDPKVKVYARKSFNNFQALNDLGDKRIGVARAGTEDRIASLPYKNEKNP